MYIILVGFVWVQRIKNSPLVVYHIVTDEKICR